MRNADKIKQLEKELGRYQKKVADQQKELREWKKKWEDLHESSKALSVAMDMNMAYLCEKYGEKKLDEDGSFLAYVLKIDGKALASAWERYEVHGGYDRSTGERIEFATLRDGKESSE